jgi:hypothetical protein
LRDWLNQVSRAAVRKAAKIVERLAESDKPNDEICSKNRNLLQIVGNGKMKAKLMLDLCC